MKERLSYVPELRHLSREEEIVADHVIALHHRSGITPAVLMQD